MHRPKTVLRLILGGCAAAWCVIAAVAEDKAAAGPGDEKGVDYQASAVLRKGVALVDDRQEERGIKLIASVPLNFPKSLVRFKAALYLGKYYANKNEYQLAIKNLTPVIEFEGAEGEERAEAACRIGECYYGLADYGRALTTLRRVTEDYPWSLYANEAYYYIGLCDFRLKRWRSAVDVLKMVGTSVAPNATNQNLVESGQRFFVKVQDKDLRVLSVTGGRLNVQVTTQSGDSETVAMEMFDPQGETYLGSIKMELGSPKRDDGRLQVCGGDVIHVDYVDANAQDGARGVKRVGTSRVVSTAAVGFMDGAYREYVQGVISGQNTFLRVKDNDADTTDQKDKIKVRLYDQYRPQKDEEAAVKDATAEEKPDYVIRDEIEVTLEETEPHSGLFTAVTIINEAKDPAAVDKKDAKLEAVEKDIVCMEYVDKEHIGGIDAPRTVVAKAEFLTGQIQDVWIAHREVNTEDLRARKNVIEARFYLKLAQIFRDVGLQSRAETKADTGLEKVNDVLRRALQVSLSQDLVEEAYQVKWELQLAKGDLDGAIGTCHTLMALYPASSLADVALLQIAKAKIEAGETPAALRVLHGVLGLKAGAELKAEAQFLIASVLESTASKSPTREDRLKAMGPAVDAYRQCAEKYPGSTFAGQSLGKVIDFYIDSKDYDRSQELLQTVFTDYPDAPFLDEMLLKWGVVLVQTKKYDEAKEKLQQVLTDYPNSASAPKAQKVLELVNAKLGADTRTSKPAPE